MKKKNQWNITTFFLNLDTIFGRKNFSGLEIIKENPLNKLKCDVCEVVYRSNTLVEYLKMLKSCSKKYKNN